MMVTFSSRSGKYRLLLLISTIFLSLILTGCKQFFSKKAPVDSAVSHFESSTPFAGATFAGVPVNVVLDFNLDLTGDSEINITLNGRDYAAGSTKVDESKLAIRRTMLADSPEGKYEVSYEACFSSKNNCESGNFSFVVDKSKAANFVDMRGRKEVTIDLSQTSFKPVDVKVSRGTKVTWVNQDNLDHYINTDAHPSHTYVLGQNSEVLSFAQKFSFTFDTLGIYPYHCSAHAENMRGNILVE